MGAGCYGPRAGTLKPGQDSPEIDPGSATGDCTVGTVDPCGDDPAPPPQPPGTAAAHTRPPTVVMS